MILYIIIYNRTSISFQRADCLNIVQRYNWCVVISCFAGAGFSCRVMFFWFPGLLEQGFDSGFDLRLESDFGFVVSNLIPPDENKGGFENELAFIEFSVIIHVVLMANHLEKFKTCCYDRVKKVG